jgi:hypothetical protein
MNVTFFDIEDSANDLNGTVIRNADELFRILDALRDRPPFVCELVGDNGFELVVGMGPNGCAQYGHARGLPPYLVALAPGREQDDGETEFLAGGTPSPIANRYCMPFDSVREIAGYFLETGGRHPAFSWEEI